MTFVVTFWTLTRALKFVDLLFEMDPEWNEILMDFPFSKYIYSLGVEELLSRAL